MTRVAADTLGRKYYDELTRSREEATRVLEIAKRYGHHNPVPLSVLLNSFHLCLTFYPIIIVL